MPYIGGVTDAFEVINASLSVERAAGSLRFYKYASRTSDELNKTRPPKKGAEGILGELERVRYILRTHASPEQVWLQHLPNVVKAQLAFDDHTPTLRKQLMYRASHL